MGIKEELQARREELALAEKLQRLNRLRDRLKEKMAEDAITMEALNALHTFMEEE